MNAQGLKRKLATVILALLMVVTFMPSLSFTTYTAAVHGATSVSDVFAGMPVTADPGTGTTAWTATDDHILQSGNKGKMNSTSTLTLTFTQDTHISFEYKVSSEAKYDKFNIKLGSTSLATDVSGTDNDWVGVETDVKSGDTMTFSYYKDRSGDKGDDTCYLRNFTAGEALVITFHNGEETKEQKIYGGSGTLQANTFTQEGKVFAGWAETADGAVKYSDGASISLTEALDLYAVWGDAYTVTFDNNGTTSTTEVAQNTAIGSVNMPKDPTRTGYTFGGWYNGDTKLTADTVISGDVTYTAKWTPISYTISFDANDGTGTMDSITATYDEEITLPENGFTRKGYTFVGWGTSSSSKSYDAGETVKNLQSKDGGTQKLYAVWAGNDVNVTVDLNYDTEDRVTTRTGVVGSNYNYIRSDSGSKFSQLKDPTRTGYLFDGWYTQAEGGDEITTQYKFDGEDALNGVTMYAHWTEAITITFDANGGSCYTTTKNIAKGSTYGSLPSASLSGKSFEGWFTAAEGGEAVDKTTVFNEDTTLYAHYRNYQNLIKFNSNGGTGTMDSLTIESGVSVNLPKNTFTREGYKFVKWCSSPSVYSYSKTYNDEAEYSWTSSWSDGYGVTLYAIWEQTVFGKAYDAINAVLPSDRIVKTTGDLGLPTSGDGYTITYTSSDTNYVDNTGNVTALPLMGTTQVTMTATVTDTSDNSTETKDFVLTIYSAEATAAITELSNAAAALTGNLTPVYGTDTNANTVISTKLAAAGYEGITVTVKEAAAASNGYASVDADGTLHYYFNPGMSGSNAYFNTTFVLSKAGASVEKQMYTVMGWDQQKVRDTLEAELERISFSSEPIEAENLTALQQYPLADGVTEPDYSDYNANKTWATITWTSSDSDVVSIGEAPYYPYYSPYAVTVNPKSYDKEVTLTASIKCNSVDAVTVTKSYTITIKGTSEDKNEAIRAELQDKLDTGLEQYGLRDAATGETLDTDNITDNIKFPTTRELKVDGKYQPVTITSSNEKVIEPWYNSTTGEVLNNASTVKVYRPLPGEDAETVTVTVTITDKATGIKVSKDIEVTVQPLTQAELDTAKSNMKKAVDSYWDGIKNANTDKDNITGDLKNFQEINVDEDGNVSFVYNADDRTYSGIVPVTYVENPDGSSDMAYRYFNSSDASVIAYSNLLVTQPTYDTEVTVDSYLSDEVYGKYYEKAKKDGDTEAMALFADLYRQHASATVTVKGVNGEDPDPDAKIYVSFKLIGASGETMLNLDSTAMGKKATAFDLLKKALEDNGYSYKGDSTYVSAIILPDGTVIDQKDHGANSGWMYKVNGETPEKVLGELKLADGDEMVFYYTTDYTATTAEVTFDSAGGSEVASITVNKGEKIAAPEDPTREGYTFDGWVDSLGNKFDFNQTIEDNVKLTASWTKNAVVQPTASKVSLHIQSKTQSSKAINVQWKKVAGAVTYEVHAHKCGKFNTCKKTKTVKGLSANITKIAGKSLKKGTRYKIYVLAKDKNGKTLAKSNFIHVATKGGKYTNTKKLTIKNSSATAKKLKKLKVGKSYTLKVKQTKQSAKKKIPHYGKLSYKSSNSKIATVNSKGKIKAKKKGTCKVTVYAQNGVYKTVTVTVK